MKKKKLIAGVLAFSMALSCTVALPENYGSVVERVYAGFGTHGTTDSTGVYNVEKSGNGFTIESIADEAKSLTTYNIPATLTANGETLPVIGLGEALFQTRSDITSVTLPNSITTIDSAAFQGCTKLTTVNIPTSLTEIPSKCFTNCTSLTTVSIPSSVTNIGESAFESCTKLSSLTLSGGVKTIGKSAFASCTSLAKVTIPGGVTTISEEAFESCTSLTNVTISSGVETIEKNAFKNCSKLSSLTISDTVTTVGDYAFQGCPNLLEVTVPKTVTDIGNYAFGFKSNGVKVDNFVLKCFTNSAADKYATANEFKVSYIDNPGHTHSYKKTSSVAATCGADGYDVYTCSCGASYNETTTSKTNNHTFGDWTITSVGATQYIMKRTCTVCGKAESKSVSRTNISNATVSGVKTSYQHTGSAITIDNDIVVTFDGKMLVKGTDYTIGDYRNNIAAGGNNTASCVITGQGLIRGLRRYTLLFRRAARAVILLIFRELILFIQIRSLTHIRQNIQARL